jgi:cytochrome c553
MKLRWKILTAFIVVAALVLPWQLFADVCHVQRINSNVYGYGHYKQQVVLKQIYQPYYYAVGTELQLDALAEKLMARLEEKQKLAERLKPPTGILATKCASCHKAGSKAEREDGAPVYFSEAGDLIATPEQRASMRTAAKLGSMPPTKELEDDQYLSLVEELKKP